MSARILVVDNYDSFVFNLVQYLRHLGAECEVWRNDVLTPTVANEFSGVLLSSGSGRPERAGIGIDLVRHVAGDRPVLGVGLGLHVIAVALGAEVGAAPEPLHGKVSSIEHSGTGVLAGLPSPFGGTRYHSLAVEPGSVPEELTITARTPSDVIMAMRHRDLAVEGVQFHPESVLTEHGYRILANWLSECGAPEAVDRSVDLATDLDS